MRFYSKPSSLWIPVVKSGWRSNPDDPESREPVVGEHVQFDGGQWDSDHYTGSLTQDALVERLRKHPSYGYPGTHGPHQKPGIERCLFWCELDRPESERMEDEMKRLRAEVEALRRIHGPQVIIVEKEVPAKIDEEGDEPALSMSDLRAEVKKLGIKAERDWKREDYERALALKEG